ncbi:MAG: DUF368 domain-containing protein [Myxococcales bacterium]|nr:DUF368 domain-containing protein [Myxococcales bacterium]
MATTNNHHQQGQQGEADIEMSEAPYIVFSGFSMGTADVVPGVSGGTMAVAMGIYAQLLRAIASVNVECIQALLGLKWARAFAIIHLRFLASLGVGIALGVGLMVKIVKLPELIHSSPKPVYAVFFGLVLGSTVLLSRRIPLWNGARIGSLLCGAGFGFAVVSLVPVATPDAPWFIFLSGFIAICAMVLPGISGSFVLLILGKYAYVLDALGNLRFGIIVPFALGALIGLATFSRVVAWALSRWHDTVLAGLTGLLLGSLWRIWPYQHLTTIIVRDKPRVVGAEPFLPTGLEPAVLMLFVAGVATVLALEFVATRKAIQPA